MKFVDELYDFYKGKLLADDEDIDILVSLIMQDLSREDMLKVLAELDDRELFQVTATYLAFKLREKLLRDQSLNENGNNNSYFH